MKEKQLWISLVVFLVLCLLVEIIGGIWTKETVLSWYPMLTKPSWTPPSWIFGPVWTTLYLMIAVSGWLIYRAEHSSKRSFALVLYGIQLVLNLMWSFFFFFLCSPILGLIDIVFLCAFIALTIIKAFSVRPLASFLLIPYLIWVVYAATLNAGIWALNR